MHPYDAGYRDELTFARAIAVNTGAILLRHFRTGLAVQMKGWADPVTAAAPHVHPRLVALGLDV